MEPIILDGTQLTFQQVVDVAYTAPLSVQVRLSPDAEKRVQRAAAAVDQLLESGQVVYGITTGFGAFKDRIISPEHAAELQRNILISHAVGTGEIFDAPTTRAIMLIRANTLSRGHS